MQFNLSLAVAFALPLVFMVRGYSLWCLLPLLLAPLAWMHVVRLRESKSPAELIALLGDTGKLLAAYAVLFAVGLSIL
jgi:1,4-dihydroxy-2-naphthoate octaprenyltransferase